MRRHAVHNAGHSRRGVSATEMAIATPLLICIFLGAADFARVFTTYSALTNAVHAGAQVGSTNRLTSFTSVAWDDRIRTTILEELQDNPRINSSQLAVDINTHYEHDGRLLVIVSATLPFQTLIKWPGLPNRVPLSYSISMEEHR